MAHYRTINIEGTDYKYVVGKYKTKITRCDPNGTHTDYLVGVFYNNAIGYTYNESIAEVRPSHVEKVIRRELKIPQREYDWDTPQTKKSDPDPRSRGFRALVSKRIIDVRVSAINEVILEDEEGCRYAIENKAGPLGIDTISLRALKGNENEDA